MTSRGNSPKPGASATSGSRGERPRHDDPPPNAKEFAKFHDMIGLERLMRGEREKYMTTTIASTERQQQEAL